MFIWNSVLAFGGLIGSMAREIGETTIRAVRSFSPSLPSESSE